MVAAGLGTCQVQLYFVAASLADAFSWQAGRPPLHRHHSTTSNQNGVNLSVPAIFTCAHTT